MIDNDGAKAGVQVKIRKAEDLYRACSGELDKIEAALLEMESRIIHSSPVQPISEEEADRSEASVQFVLGGGLTDEVYERTGRILSAVHRINDQLF